MSIEAMKLALDALNEAVAFREGGRQKANDAINALRAALSQQPAAQTEREAFEAWARPNGYDLRRNDVLGHYSSLDTSRAWAGFRAGRASLPAPQQPATPEPVAWPLRARVWKRESTQEWVLEIAGTLGDTDMNIRHTQPLSVAYENVPGLPAFYTHPAPSVPDDVVRDAERYRWLRLALADREKGVSHHFCSIRYSEELDEAIDAAMLAAKDAK